MINGKTYASLHQPFSRSTIQQLIIFFAEFLPNHRASIAVEQVTIYRDFTISHVAEHVPMNAGRVLATTFRETGPDSQMNGTAHLLVK